MLLLVLATATQEPRNLEIGDQTVALQPYVHEGTLLLVLLTSKEPSTWKIGGTKIATDKQAEGKTCVMKRSLATAGIHNFRVRAWS